MADEQMTEDVHMQPGKMANKTGDVGVRQGSLNPDNALSDIVCCVLHACNRVARNLQAVMREYNRYSQPI
jgi:phage terminase large subunit-like protein